MEEELRELAIKLKQTRSFSQETIDKLYKKLKVLVDLYEEFNARKRRHSPKPRSSNSKLTTQSASSSTQGSV